MSELIWLLGYAKKMAKQGKRTEALDAVYEALEIDPRNAMAWYQLSQLTDDPVEATGALDTILRIDPRNKLALLGYEKLGHNLPEMGNVSVPVSQDLLISGNKTQDLAKNLQTFGDNLSKLGSSITCLVWGFIAFAVLIYFLTK